MKIKLLAASLLLVLNLVAHAKQHPFSVHDMLAAHRVGASQVSNEGSKAVFSVKTINEKNGQSNSDLWLIDLNSGDLKQITHTPRAESSYQWSKDDKNILFSRGKTIWKQPVSGKKASKITTLPLSIETFKLSPDGLSIIFSSRVFVDCNSLQCSAKKLLKKESNKQTGKLYQQLFVRHWDTWNDGLRSHLFWMPLPQKSTPAKDIKITDITQGFDADVPSLPFGGSEEYNFSSDNKSVYFSAKNVGKKEAWSTNFDIYQADLTQLDTPVKNLTELNKAWDTLPITSPDNKWLAYTAMHTPAYEADKFEIKLINLVNGEVKSLTHNWDRSISSMIFTADSQQLLVTTQDSGNHSIYKIDINNGKRQALITKGKNTSVQLSKSHIIYNHNDLKMPTEIFKLSLTGGKPQQLTYFNKPLLSKVKLGNYEQFSFKGWNNEKVFGYIVKPIDFNPRKKYPMAFLIHGGPQGSFYNQFHYRWNPQVYAAEGYVAVMIDFHGSTGYGQKFTDSIQSDWGGKPLEDLKKGFKAVVKKYPFIDGKNACALGASYGGYMINWIASQWTDGFKCLINHDGVFDNRMMFFSTEELWFVERENKGTYYDYAANYEKHNPVNYVNQWKTPMFVIQGGHDYRIPESQSLGAFTALQRQSIDSQLLYFPEENHWILKPENSIQWHNEVLAWLKKYLKTK